MTQKLYKAAQGYHMMPLGDWFIDLEMVVILKTLAKLLKHCFYFFKNVFLLICKWFQHHLETVSD